METETTTWSDFSHEEKATVEQILGPDKNEIQKSSTVIVKVSYSSK